MPPGGERNKVRANQALIKAPWLVSMGAMAAAANYYLTTLMSGIHVTLPQDAVITTIRIKSKRRRVFMD